MKKFEHIWNPDFFLLHIQLNNNGNAFEAHVIREYEGGTTQTEVVSVHDQLTSFRFIISKTHPKEIQVSVEYPDDVILEAFKVDDRAYYPTESFFVG